MRSDGPRPTTTQHCRRVTVTRPHVRGWLWLAGRRGDMGERACAMGSGARRRQQRQRSPQPANTRAGQGRRGPHAAACAYVPPLAHHSPHVRCHHARGPVLSRIGPRTSRRPAAGHPLVPAARRARDPIRRARRPPSAAYPETRHRGDGLAGRRRHLPVLRRIQHRISSVLAAALLGSSPRVHGPITACYVAHGFSIQQPNSREVDEYEMNLRLRPHEVTPGASVGLATHPNEKPWSHRREKRKRKGELADY